MNVIMISPGHPVEMSFFTRALARVRATVIGVGDQPPDALPPAAPREGRYNVGSVFKRAAGICSIYLGWAEAVVHDESAVVGALA